MDDNSLNNMVNMMKTNPGLMKETYERQSGIKMSDDQFNNMMQMMNPEMIKMTSNMMKTNPDMMKQAMNIQAQRNATQPTPTTQTKPQDEPKAKTASSGTGTVDDPIIQEVEDIGFSSSVNEREQR